MGCTSYYGALNVLIYLKRLLEIDFVHVMLTNIVAKFSIADMYESIDIEAFRDKYRQFCSYNPTVFPSCSFKMTDSNIKINIFASGKIVLAGPKSDRDIRETIEFIMKRFDTVFKRKQINGNIS
eukprot:CAMPEP_0171513212 /NCGR_PEP_ID=MMETSP0959-20130129/2087_1 /TAXON_ID=87120 /ORGANISM="Aurantiochytrium limacinum, Strain ATCCMYA-1381" /LENGTH=123 /DNA_ID=CAMNT_0012051249 /DNA_START=963 /DNA_END=1334 /DNA_ORIENTATION=-